MIWFPFYSSDFIGATVGLSCLERALYALMLPLYYEAGPFPVDKVRVYRIVGCESDEQKRAVDYLLETFFVLMPDGWYQPRAEREKAKDAQIRELARTKANKRWHGAPHDAAALLRHCRGNTAAMPPTPTPTPTPTTKGKAKAHAPRAAAAPPDVSQQVWDDWVALRRAKRAAVTPTAVAGIRRQAEIAGMTLEAALALCCERGWAGFKAEWVTPDRRATTLEERNRAVAEQIKAMIDNEERTING